MVATLVKDQKLLPDQSVAALNGRAVLLMQGDGNLVLSSARGRYLWDSATDGFPGAHAIMQGDGNLVVYSTDGVPRWASHTAGHDGATLTVQDDANVGIYNTAGVAVWASNTPVVPTLFAGQKLLPGRSLAATNDCAVLLMQGDGNLVLSTPTGGYLWDSATGGFPGAHAAMQAEDGNFVVYSKDGVPRWASHTSGHPGATLTVHDNRNVGIHNTAGVALWASNTAVTATLFPDQKLLPDQSLPALNGRVVLLMQGDGNLVLSTAKGQYLWDSATDGFPGAHAIMQGDGNFVVYSRDGTARWASHTSGHPEATLTVQDDGNVVLYGTGGVALWASHTAVERSDIAGFSVDEWGFNYSNNDWANNPVPIFTMHHPFEGIRFDTSGGLCGGMVFATRDYFEANRRPPADTSHPPASDPRFPYMLSRLYDSWGFDHQAPFAANAIRYWNLQQPTMSDHDTWFGSGRANEMCKEWPKIKQDLDSGHLSPMGLVQVKSFNPAELGLNHQVLAYGYEWYRNMAGVSEVTIKIYDPNDLGAGGENARISFHLHQDNPGRTMQVDRSPAVSRPIYAFFRSDYVHHMPPA